METQGEIRKGQELFNQVKDYFLNEFPEKDGWKYYKRYNWRRSIDDFVIIKDSKGAREAVILSCNQSEIITADHLKEFVILGERLGTNGIKINQRIYFIRGPELKLKGDWPFQFLPISALPVQRSSGLNLSGAKIQTAAAV